MLSSTVIMVSTVMVYMPLMAMTMAVATMMAWRMTAMVMISAMMLMSAMYTMLLMPALVRTVSYMPIMPNINPNGGLTVMQVDRERPIAPCIGVGCYHQDESCQNTRDYFFHIH